MYFFIFKTSSSSQQYTFPYTYHSHPNQETVSSQKDCPRLQESRSKNRSEFSEGYYEVADNFLRSSELSDEDNPQVSLRLMRSDFGWELILLIEVLTLRQVQLLFCFWTGLKRLDVWSHKTSMGMLWYHYLIDLPAKNNEQISNVF